MSTPNVIDLVVARSRAEQLEKLLRALLTSGHVHGPDGCGVCRNVRAALGESTPEEIAEDLDALSRMID